MSNDISSLIESLGESEAQPQVELNSSEEIQKEPNQTKSWMAPAFLVGFVLALFLFWNRAKQSNENVKIQSPCLLILEESESRRSLKPGQVAIFNSVPLREFYEKNDIEYRRYDVQDNIDKEPKEFRELREMITIDPPCVIFAAKNRASEFKLPADPQAMESRLKQLIGGKR